MSPDPRHLFAIDPDPDADDCDDEEEEEEDEEDEEDDENGENGEKWYLDRGLTGLHGIPVGRLTSVPEVPTLSSVF